MAKHVPLGLPMPGHSTIFPSSTCWLGSSTLAAAAVGSSAHCIVQQQSPPLAPLPAPVSGRSQHHGEVGLAIGLGPALLQLGPCCHNLPSHLPRHKAAPIGVLVKVGLHRQARSPLLSALLLPSPCHPLAACSTGPRPSTRDAWLVAWVRKRPVAILKAASTGSSQAAQLVMAKQGQTRSKGKAPCTAQPGGPGWH